MSRFQVFQRRLAPTLAALLLVWAVARLLWFPGPYFEMLGIGKLVLVLVGVNLVVGPGLTALVFRAGKPGLIFDFVALALLEVTILGWATYSIYLRAPAYVVFAVDRFEVVSAGEIDRAMISDPRLRRRPGHEPRLVFAEMPAAPEKLDKLLDDVLLQGLPDIDRQPEFWKPYSAGIAKVKQQARPLADLLAPDDERAHLVRRWLASTAAEPQAFVYLPIRAKARFSAMIVHADIGYPVGVIPIDPW